MPYAEEDLEGTLFQSVKAIEIAVQIKLQRMSKNGFENVFLKWQKQWGKCIKLRGEYVERARNLEE